MSSSERGIPPVPDGFYLAADPETGRPTLWQAVKGDLKDYPRCDGVRWRPFPPQFTELPRNERAAARQDWYTRVYWPWRAAVAEAILQDLVGAAAAFTEQAESIAAGATGPALATSGCRQAPKKAKARVRARGESSAPQERVDQALLVSALHASGRSIREIGALVTVPRSTVARRLVNVPDDVPATVRMRAELLQRLSGLEGALAGIPDEGQRATARAMVEEIRNLLRDRRRWE